MDTHVAMGTVEIRLRKGGDAKDEADRCHGPTCNKPAEYFNRTFRADGSIVTWPCDAAGKPVAMFSACVCGIDNDGFVTCECEGPCECKSKNGVAMSNELTADGKAICARLGISEAEYYIAARNRRQQKTRGGAPAVALDAHSDGARPFAGVALKDDELVLCPINNFTKSLKFGEN